MPLQDASYQCLADSQALTVGELVVDAGCSKALDQFDGTAALLFDSGEGHVTISGCRHPIEAGRVEVVCPGEACAISATTKTVHAYLILAKSMERTKHAP